MPGIYLKNFLEIIFHLHLTYNIKLASGAQIVIRYLSRYYI